MKVVLVGGVNSTAVTLRKLCEHNVSLVRVFGYRPLNAVNVSGYCDLESICVENKIPYTPFLKINEHAADFSLLDADIIFVVGLSQLISSKIIESAKVGSIGFHPTQLPVGRGRAPLAWLVSEVENGAATFFLLEEEADAGAILAQENFNVALSDSAQDVEDKLLLAMGVALDILLPKLQDGWWNPTPQDELLATEYGIRKPEDGLIDWNSTVYNIDRLIKAASFPHPGAHTFCNDKKLIVTSSRLESNLKIKGVIGRILKANNSEFLVQAADGCIWIKFNKKSHELRVGTLLGYKVENEIFELKNKIKELYELLGNNE